MSHTESETRSHDHHHHHHHGHHRNHDHPDASPANQPPHRFIGEDDLLKALDKKDVVKVVDTALDLNTIANEVASTAAGAIATFSGTTRDHHNGKRVLKLEYEAYVPMAEKEMFKICQEMREKWPVRSTFSHDFITYPLLIKLMGFPYSYIRLFTWQCIIATAKYRSQRRQ